MKHFDDLKYIDYVIKFTNQTDRTNELMLVCLTLREVIEKSLFGENRN